MKILLHLCCSNCALYPVKILRSEGYDFTGFWFNPNIHPTDEYQLRLDSVQKLSRQWDIGMIYSDEYDPEEFFKLFQDDRVKGSAIPPSPGRCKLCYTLRLEKTAKEAQKRGYDAFSTTLLISPYQDHDEIIETGKKLAEKYKTDFHAKDFRPHFRDAMTLAKDLGLYRQKYCGCIFSSEERSMKRSKIKTSP